MIKAYPYLEQSLRFYQRQEKDRLTLRYWLRQIALHWQAYERRRVAQGKRPLLGFLAALTIDTQRC